MGNGADLHIHTRCSDGADAPETVVSIAVKKDLQCIAITDHDTVDGIAPAMEAAAGTGLEVIAGVELSSHDGGRDIHILGYCFDPEHAVFQERLRLFRETRLTRIQRMLEKLDSLGMTMSLEDVMCLADSDAVGRPHVARLMMERGYVQSISEAFDEYLGEGSAAYVEKFRQTPQEAIQLIRQAGGVAVMAHPMHTLKDELIPGLVEAGLQGLEVYYPNTSPRVIAFYERIADKHRLIKTGGSDAHGSYRNYNPIGIVRVDPAVVEQLRAASQAGSNSR